MKVFDRRFLKYQLAALKHNKYKNKILYPNIIIFFVGFYYRNTIPILLLCIGLIAGSIYFGYYRFNKETGATEKEFEKEIKKKYEEYENSLRQKEVPGIELQKVALGVELDIMSVDEAIEKISKIFKEEPKLRKFATNILISLYRIKYQDNDKIPKEYIDFMEKTIRKEKNVNYLSDSAMIYQFMGEYSKAINVLNKVEEELDKIKKIRKPVYNAIYRTTIISAPFYKGESYRGLGNKEKAKQNFERALEKCKSKTFRNVIVDAIESL